MLKTNIKKLRTENNLTQEELAKVLNLSVSTISMYETGTREPDISTIIKLANYFNVTTDFLLGITENANFTITTSSPTTDISQYVKNLIDAINNLREMVEKNSQ